MSLFSKLIDIARRACGVRVERSMAPIGRRPPIGTYIAKEDVRMRVTHEFSDDAWQWLTMSGWRVIYLQSDRRRYRSAPKRAFERLAEADPESRASVEQAAMEQAVMTSRELRRQPIGNLYAKRRDPLAVDTNPRTRSLLRTESSFQRGA